MSEKTCSATGFKALMCTQFLGALNDNVFKVLLTLFVVNTLVQETGGILHLILINVCFVTPFLLFSALAGSLADRFSKSKMIQYIKALEIIIMCLGLVFLSLQNVYGLLVVLFLMGLQSALFSPAKYGILPEILSEEALSKGNGYIEFWTFLAIIFGTAAGGFLSSTLGDSLLAGFVVVAIAITGFSASQFVTKTTPASPDKSYALNPFQVIGTLRELKNNRALFLCVTAIAYFWAVGALFQLNLVLYAKELAGLDDLSTSLLMAALGVGIGFGSVMAGIVSEGRVELGLVPIGAVGIGAFSILLSFSYSSFAMTVVFLLGLGLSAGFFTVPLNSYLQEYSPSEKRGDYIAASNFVSFGGMLVFSFLLLFLIDGAGLSSAHVFFFMGVTALGIAVYVCRVLPEVLIRCLNWLFVHTLYRVKVLNRENLPSSTGALLVCNHISFVDAMLVLAAAQRPVRFLMYKPIYESRFVHPIAKSMGAIPVQGGKNKEEVARSLQGASDAIRDGELVCIFAEGAISRVGQLLKFRRGLERIMSEVSAPIIPVHLDQLWGSIFSYRGGKFFWKRPAKIPYPVTVSFGKPLESNSPSHVVRAAVQELGAEAFEHRDGALQLLHRGFIHAAKRRGAAPCVVDSSGKRLNFRNTLAQALILTKYLKEVCGEQRRIGVYLPPSVDAVLANIALLMSGRIPVNLDSSLSGKERRRVLEQVELKTIITSKPFLDKVSFEVEGMTEQVRRVFIEKGLEASFSKRVGYWFASVFLSARAIETNFCSDRVTKNDCATISFTRGTGGKPKGVMLSHANICANVSSVCELFELDDEECVLGILQFSRTLGLTGTLWYPLLAGCRAFYCDESLEKPGFSLAIEKEKATLLVSTPTMLHEIADNADRWRYKNLKTVFVGGESLNEKLRGYVEEKLKVNVLEGYGSTELSPFALVNRFDFEGGRDSQIGNKAGTVGHPLPGIAVKIVAADTGKELGPNEEGLLMVKGPNVMLGYLNDKEGTERVMQEGWYQTGDLASIDDDGFVSILENSNHH